MNLINDLRLSRLVNGDFYQFIENIVSIANNEPLLEGIIQDLKKDVPQLLNSYQKEQLTLETKHIAQLDNKRDRSYLKLKTLIDAYAYDDNQDILLAAAKLKLIIDHYGNGQLVIFDYNKETAGITALIDDMRTKASSELKLLDLTRTVSHLETCNNEFKTYYASRGDAASTLAAVPAFYKLRKEVAVHYRTFAADLESLQRFVPEHADLIAKLISRINVEIEKFRLLIPLPSPSKDKTTVLLTIAETPETSNSNLI